MREPEYILLADIDANPQYQVRAAMNTDAIAEYAEAMLAGAEFPAIDVVFDGLSTYYLVDGRHRHAAAGKAGESSILANIVDEGTARDALLLATAANQSHGLRRTNADKRRAVEVLLRDAEWAQWSDRKIAEQCGVGADLVGSVRRELQPQHQVSETDTCEESTPVSQKRKGKDGKEYPVPEPRAERKKQAEPAPAAAKKKPGAETVSPIDVAACKKSWGSFIRLLDKLGWMHKVDGATKEIAATLKPLWKDA